jgi:hypothetical protein
MAFSSDFDPLGPLESRPETFEQAELVNIQLPCGKRSFQNWGEFLPDAKNLITK